ncbi:hypothetical protein [Synoicihabitans lomoniglobus]|uniref:Uncharacterized protein n=1 Tax=Synoicihabitans lomoniglobus TaxID=2909285 RepID=A0AAE9ZVW4_9BACT|nr:hypothetical protein [Opitutaceae bacterium LMO-M01]WED63443.1 hypothetical protein PXH66_13975 [Opitutaceae bacterium LMO-M01]
MPSRREPVVKRLNRHLWLVEPLEDEPTFLIKAMFGGKAVYLHGRFILFLADKEEPWRGVLVPTEREHQPSLIADRPALAPHEILGKWLYLPEAADSFETDAQWLVQRARAGDERVGIIPPMKRARKRKSPASRPGQGNS